MLNVTKSVFLVLAMFIVGFHGNALAYDVNAGPIWDEAFAKEKCPGICSAYGGWNGNWVTTVEDKMSVCGCNSGRISSNDNDANSAPIADNSDGVHGKCAEACRWNGGWNGNWTNEYGGSVCGCRESLDWHGLTGTGYGKKPEIDLLAKGMSSAACELLIGPASEAVDFAACTLASAGMCALASVAIIAAGGGPEDPVADVASAVLGTECETAVDVVCHVALTAAGELTDEYGLGKECEKSLYPGICHAVQFGIDPGNVCSAENLVD